MPALVLVLAACHVPPGRAEPVACRATDPAGAAWTAEASRRAIAHDTLLADVLAREGPWRSCVGERLATSNGAPEGHGRLVFTFAGGTVLAIESLPPESSVVSLRRPGGLTPEADWIGLLKRYAAARGVPVDWSRPATSRAPDGALTLRFGSVEPGWNAGAAVEHDAAGRLVALTLSLAL